MVESGRFCVQPTHYRLYFSARFDRPFTAHGTWSGESSEPGARSVSAPAAAPARYVTFGRRGRRVEARVRDLVRERRRRAREPRRGARAQLRRRCGAAARRTWARTLGRVDVERRPARATAVSSPPSLYHALLEPSVFSDRDGRYRGMDGRVHRARGFTKYADVSGWDVYRGQTQLLAMLFPRRAADVASSLLADARESGCLPRWPYANQQTNVMVGDPAAPILASTFALGARRFDTRAALRALVRGADRPCHTENGDYTAARGPRRVPAPRLRPARAHRRRRSSTRSARATSRGAPPPRRSSTRSPTSRSRGWRSPAASARPRRA